MHKIMAFIYTPLQPGLQPGLLAALLAALLVLSLLSISAIAVADSDHLQARQLLESGEILPLQSILTKLRRTHPGRVLEVELEKHNNRVIYEIEIRNADGLVSEVYIDAKSGEILSGKKDN